MGVVFGLCVRAKCLDFMKNAFFKLPFSFNKQMLSNDLETCLSENWKAHFNSQDYEGSWTSIALRSPTGKADDILTIAKENCYFDTPLLGKCRYLKEIIESFECAKETVRLLRLSPNSVVKEHNDFQLGYEYGFFRLHIPINTSSEVSFRVGGTEIPMTSGECWYANFHLPHSVANQSNFERIHLVIDCLRNDWSDKLFESIGFDFAEAERITKPDETTVKLMIERLKEMNTATANELIKQYENV
jgi:Aspartyl/Asparaginyl beta-hydroxylase